MFNRTRAPLTPRPPPPWHIFFVSQTYTALNIETKARRHHVNGVLEDLLEDRLALMVPLNTQHQGTDDDPSVVVQRVVGVAVAGGRHAGPVCLRENETAPTRRAQHFN